MPPVDLKVKESTNYLVVQRAPETHTEEFYEDEKTVKTDFTYISGP